jgi:hypothetical protein
LTLPPSNEAFLDSDARETIDDNLFFITRDLPKFRSLHGSISNVIMGTADNIEEPLEKVHAYQYILKALKYAIPLLKAFTIKLVQDITQIKLTVSTAKTAVDEHNYNARSSAASGAAGET